MVRILIAKDCYLVHRNTQTDKFNFLRQPHCILTQSFKQSYKPGRISVTRKIAIETTSYKNSNLLKVITSGMNLALHTGII